MNNALGGKFTQLYFEEAHNLFPIDDKDLTGVYARFAKEGAKLHIGIVYLSTIAFYNQQRTPCSDREFLCCAPLIARRNQGVVKGTSCIWRD